MRAALLHVAVGAMPDKTEGKKAASPQRRGDAAATRRAVKRLLCVIPRQRALESLNTLLPGYSLLTASSLTGTRTAARGAACDAYIIQSPVGWNDAAGVCRYVRSFDAQTPIVVYALTASASERREVIAAGAQAYVTRSDDSHNLHGRVGQLIMLAELRSMDAMSSHAEAMQERIANHLAQIAGAPTASARLKPDAQARLKVQAARLFTKAGGTRANFERLWPAIYQRALNTLDKPGA